MMILMLSCLIAWRSQAQNVVKRPLQLMGCSFEVTVVTESETNSNQMIDLAVAEMLRIEQLISSWDTNSQTSKINSMSGIQPVKVDKELFDLILRANKISTLTSGAFDITYASMDRIWKFDGSVTSMPDADIIAQSVALIGYQNIVLDEVAQTVFLPKKGMRIGFGAIGKGYAADRAKQLLQSKGVKSGIINASGDLNAWGSQPDGKPWMVGITNPLNKDKVFSWLPITNQAVVTSGNYEKYILLNGQRYTHIIDPRTGMPSKGLVSVSVFSSNAEISDALATSLFVMGVSVGLDFINQLKGIECIMIDEFNQIHVSNHIELKNVIE